MLIIESILKVKLYDCFYKVTTKLCQSYHLQNDPSRSNEAPFQAVLQSDDRLENVWYRFNGGNNSQVIHTKCVTEYGKCGTFSPGWMKGEHPTGNANIY